MVRESSTIRTAASLTGCAGMGNCSSRCVSMRVKMFLSASLSIRPNPLGLPAYAGTEPYLIYYATPDWLVNRTVTPGRLNHDTRRLSRPNRSHYPGWSGVAGNQTPALVLGHRH